MQYFAIRHAIKQNRSDRVGILDKIQKSGKLAEFIEHCETFRDAAESDRAFYARVAAFICDDPADALDVVRLEMEAAQ